MSRILFSLLVCCMFAGTVAADDFKPIFNGKNLKGWNGDPKLWSVQDGAITGVTTDKNRLPYNKFIIWQGKVKNFELRAKVRMFGNSNSGIQYRSQHLKKAGEFVVGGYQCDIHPSPNYNGMLYDERGRGILAQNGQKVIIDPQGNKWVVQLGKPKPVKLDQWNDYVIIAKGNHLIHKINGNTTVEVFDYQKSQRELEGIVAFQVHVGPAMKVQFKDIQLKKLPEGGLVAFDKSSIPANAKKIPGPKQRGKKKRRARKAAQVRSAANGPMPNWIWLGEKAIPGQVAFFRKDFQVNGPIKSAKLYGTCDDRMMAFLNGKEVMRSETWQSPSFADVTKEIKAGENILAVRGKNDQSNIAGLLVKLVIETKDKKTQVIVSDSSWRVAHKPRKGWKRAKFSDNSWAQATVLGKLGDGPWVQVNRASLAAASKQRVEKATFLNQLHTLKGFKVESLYTVPGNQGSWVSLTTDPKGRLIASDQYGKLYRITPPALDGKANDIKVEPIDIALGEAQGLLWAFDSLYVMVNRGGRYQSGLYRVRDTDGDDKFDKVEMLRSLAGAGEHGPHAVILSPDGKSLFVCCGNHTNLTNIDSSRPTRVWGEDSLLPRMWDASGHARGRMAPAGCIYKVSPDGKTWQLWCMGFRNEYDIAFNREGELFTFDSDMEWDMNTPWYRPTRVCHCISGAGFGWRGGTAKFPVYYPDNLPPVVDIGPGSPTGVVFGYGAKFPAKYQDAFYICDWSYGKLYAVHMQPDGSTYKGTAEEFITGTPLPLTDIVVNPKDGAMYFAVGGRRVKSALYRVTYTGKESTAPSKAGKEGASARQQRHKLEAYHVKQDPKAIDVAWPSLSKEDRFLRWAARTAIEHQEPELWHEKALKETNVQASLEALLALVRCGNKSLQPRVLEALDRFQWKELDHAKKLALLRVYGLTFIRMGEPNNETRQHVIQRFDPHYPAQDKDLNWELSKLLVYLQAPSAAAKTMKLLRGALTQEEQMAYALSLRNLKTGWTRELRREYFKWFPKALGYKGGHSFQGFVRNIRTDAVATLTAKEKSSLQKLLEAGPIVAPTAIETKPRPFVKKWTVDELAKIIETEGLKNRDFNRGRRMFAAARCFACHRFNNEGGATGPDLTGVSGRFSPKDLLESLIEPSKTVSDQYQAVIIVLNDGRVINGRIVNLAGNSLRVNTDMFDPEKQIGVNRRQIDTIVPSKESMMPTGLVDTLNKEEILDLVAYLLSRGDRNNAMFRKKE